MVIKGPVLRLTAKRNYDQVPLPVKRISSYFQKGDMILPGGFVISRKGISTFHLPQKRSKISTSIHFKRCFCFLGPCFFFQGSITYFLCHTTGGWGRCQFLAASISTGSGLGDGSWNLSPLKFEIDCSKMVTPHLNRDICSTKPSLLVSMLKKMSGCKFDNLERKYLEEKLWKVLGMCFVYLILVCVICSWGSGIKT